MKKLLTILTLYVLSVVSYAQDEQYVLNLINSERPKNHQLVYQPNQQSRLNSIASHLPTRYCHCYAGYYKGEVITRATSLDNAVAMFMASDKHREILNSRNAKSITIGVFKKDEEYYVVARTY